MEDLFKTKSGVVYTPFPKCPFCGEYTSWNESMQKYFCKGLPNPNSWYKHPHFYSTTKEEQEAFRRMEIHAGKRWFTK